MSTRAVAEMHLKALTIGLAEVWLLHLLVMAPHVAECGDLFCSFYTFPYFDKPMLHGQGLVIQLKQFAFPYVFLALFNCLSLEVGTLVNSVSFNIAVRTYWSVVSGMSGKGAGLLA